MKIIGPKELPVNDYSAILKYMPIACVDIVLVHNGRFLMGRRANKPAQGQWWLPGGRVWKGENQKQAVLRKSREETGLKVGKIKFLHVEDTMFPDSSKPGISTHTINTVYRVEPVGIVRLGGDAQHEKFAWFSKINPKWHPYVKRSLRAAGFK